MRTSLFNLKFGHCMWHSLAAKRRREEEPQCQIPQREKKLSSVLSQGVSCSRSQTQCAVDLWIPIKIPTCGEWAFHNSSVLIRVVSDEGAAWSMHATTQAASNKMTRMFSRQTMHKSLSQQCLLWTPGDILIKRHDDEVWSTTMWG